MGSSGSKARPAQVKADAAPAQLTYWDGQGNAEIIRLMMAACGQVWEDKVALDASGTTHISTEAQFEGIAAAGLLAFDQLPLLQIDGLNIVQKYAAVRYLARKHGLYGKDNAEATQIDIISDSLLDFGGGGKNALEKKSQDKYLPRIERALGGKAFLVGDRLSFVDVQLFYVLENIVAAQGSDYLSAYPGVKAHYEMIMANKRISAYLEDSSKRFPRPGREGYFDRVKATIPFAFAGENYTMSSKTWNYRSQPASAI